MGYELACNKKFVPESLIDNYLSVFKLDGIKDAFPNELSAGMKQRVQMIQSLIGETGYLLMDEPFSNLDYDVKLHVQSILKRIHRRTKNTLIIVTHDIEDAISLSDEIVVLSAKPTRVLETLPVAIDNSDPVAVRSNPLMADYFMRIWSFLKVSL